MADRKPRIAWLVLALAWIGAALIINPSGDFPLNDDWAYGRVVQSLHVLGRLQFPAEVAVSLVAHSAWGLLFVKLFGFSFGVLRLSTLVAGLAGVVFSFELFRALDVKPTLRWLGTLCVGFTPLYLSLSYTYMTDVFFFTACVGALLFYIHFLRAQREHHFWIALVFALLAVLTRDAAIVVPAAMGVTGLLRSRDGSRFSWRGWLPLVVCLIVLLVYQQWLVAADRMPAAYGIRARRLVSSGAGDLLPTALVSARAIVCYIGLLLLPLLLPVGVGRFIAAARPQRMRALAIGAAVMALLIGWSLIERSVLPSFGGNVLSRASLGPVILPFASTFLGTTSGLFWMPVTLLAIVGAAMLAILVSDAVREVHRRADAAELLVMIVAAVYAGALLFTPVRDRYLLLLLPLTVVLVGMLEAQLRRWTLSVSGLLLVAMVALSVAGTHDYLAWNRARWSLARDLFSREPPELLDGGLEVEAWYAYPLDRPFVRDRTWWWMAPKPYVITLGELADHRLVAREPAGTWLPFGDGYIYLLRQD